MGCVEILPSNTVRVSRTAVSSDSSAAVPSPSLSIHSRSQQHDHRFAGSWKPVRQGVFLLQRRAPCRNQCSCLQRVGNSRRRHALYPNAELPDRGGQPFHRKRSGDRVLAYLGGSDAQLNFDNLRITNDHQELPSRPVPETGHDDPAGDGSGQSGGIQAARK